MRHMNHAKLAACLSVWLLIGADTLKEPIKVRFHLADGVLISGDLATWDREGFSGSFGRRQWTDLDIDDLWRLHLRLMDQQSTQQWVDLGRVLLLTRDRAGQEATEYAERAFARALKLDPEASKAIEEVRREAEAAERRSREAQTAAKAARLNTVSPEGRDWSADPWPVLTAPEQSAAVLEMRTDAQRILKQAGAAFLPLETDRFIMYTDSPRPEAAHWLMQLEKVYDTMNLVLAGGEIGDAQHGGGPQQRAISPWGKVVVFVFSGQDRFRLVEAESFNQLVANATVAIAHPVGPKVFVNAHRGEDEELFQWSMLHETALALMHRYRAPRRLPAWANEGLAEYVTALVQPESSIGAVRRSQGLAYIRTGGNVNAILDRSYAEQTWPGTDAMGLPIGALLIELLLEEQPKKLIGWIDAVKQGAEWPAALIDQFGSTRERLMTTFVQFYKVND